MTTETFLDLAYDRVKSSKRPLRPKLLKLTDVTVPHRSRKKTKVKSKDRSTNVRDRIHDDPAYTEDISHLANPLRRSSISGKSLGEYKLSSEGTLQTVATSSSLGKRSQLTKDFLKYAPSKPAKSGKSGAISLDYDFESSSSDNEQANLFQNASIPRRVLSLERSLASSLTEKNEKKPATQKRTSKQKRNLSLDNSRKVTQSNPQQTSSKGRQTLENRSRKEYNRKQYLESETQLTRGASDHDEVYSVRSSVQNSAATLPVDSTVKLPIGRRLLKGEIGIKSFNYYLLKEGLKSSKKNDKQRNISNVADNSDIKLHTRSEENIYEEIFFKDIPSSSPKVNSSETIPPADVKSEEQQKCLPDTSVFTDCELCMQQCSNENCKYCLGEGGPTASSQLQDDDCSKKQAASASGLPAAHILEFQSYNPNNPGVYKIETTPVAITGEYNPILQFQQSSETTSTTATISPCKQQLQNFRSHQQKNQQQQKQQQQQQQHTYCGFTQNHKVAQHSTICQPIPNHYTAGSSLLLAQVTPRRPNIQQGYVVGFQNSGLGATTTSVQRINTKSSSSSDSLPYHKYNTMARLEANVFAAPATGDIYYAVGGVGGPAMHPLMYAASRPLGGSQILVDQFESQMYKSDSRASILSEFSLRSSDNSQRYARYPHRSSLVSSNSNTQQRRYFGSTESCRIGYDCRRCSLDGFMGTGVIGMTTPDKCSNTNNCRLECRNCDCSSSYFSSDFDDIYGSMARGGSSGIPRKTAAGTLPSSGSADPSNFKHIPEDMPKQSPQLDLKQNKYAMDFFKHVNDVKRSIYQSEMQRNNSLESKRREHKNSGNVRQSPKRSASQPPLSVTTLPLSKGRNSSATKPTPAPRTILQNAAQQMSPEKIKLNSANSKPEPTERRQYPSLDRLVASTTGAISKWQGHTPGQEEPSSSKLLFKNKGTEPRERRYQSGPADSGVADLSTIAVSKRHHRSNNSKAHASVGNPVPIIRRKDIPAPPPPSPATYSDLQELKANMEGHQDDTKSRSVESETSETVLATAPAKEKKHESVHKGAIPDVHTAKHETTLTSLAEISESTAKPTSVSKAMEGEDDDVFYDAHSENSTGSLSIIPTADRAVHAASTPGKMCKDVGILLPEVHKPNQNAPSAISTLTTENKEQQQLSKAKVKSEVQSTSATVSTTASQQSPIDDQDDELKHSISTLKLGNKKSWNKCCQSEAPESIQQNEATVKTNIEIASTTKRSNNTTTLNVTARNVEASCVKGQDTSLTATNVANKYKDSNNDNDSTTVEATLELEFSCNSAHTDNATLTNSDPPTLTQSVVTCQDFTCLDSSEAFSDDSHLTRESVTRESQNDELSTSTLDKLDLSTLPLPALPPKRRRTRSRASPSKHHHHHQSRIESNEYAEAAEKSATISSQAYRNQNQERDSLQDSSKADSLGVPDNVEHQRQLSKFQQYVAKRRDSLEASTRNFNEKLEARRMLCHMDSNGAATGPSVTDGVPTYLFGEQFYGVPDVTPKSRSPLGKTEEIFLNKSGWVQVSTRLKGENKSQRLNRQNGDSALLDKPHGRNAMHAIIQRDQSSRPELCRQSIVRQPSSRCEPERKFVGSKVEELIQRNEARLSGVSSKDSGLRPGYRIIDPQLASKLNERPGFLPVNDIESPPPITPILSPPPAFQDNSSNIGRTARHQERRKVTRQSITPIQQARSTNPPLQLNAQQQQLAAASGTTSAKGMVFSRSFEYDTRRPTNSYMETFSRSFDDNLSERKSVKPSLAVQRERSLNFSTLTGNSPNYLTKREVTGGCSSSVGRSIRSRDNSPKYLHPQTTAYLNTSVKEAPPGYSVANSNLAKSSSRLRNDRNFERSKSQNIIGRSRKSQLSYLGSSSPEAPPPAALGISRFRSLDTTINNRLNSCDSGARSDLSNDEIDNEDGSSTEFLSATNYQYPIMASGGASSPFKTQRQRSLTPDRNESHSSSTSLRKQRSLTPESRSLTPEERRRKGSQISLIGSRQSSSSRSNTLERRQRHDEKAPLIISRSSSSSSYSGGESHERLNGSPSTCVDAGGVTATTNSRRSTSRSSSNKAQENLIRRSRSLQLSERSPNRTKKSIGCVTAASSMQKHLAAAHYQPVNSSMFPNLKRSTVSSNKALHNPNEASKLRQSDVDKACSFDFDYSNYNRSGNAVRTTNTGSSNVDSASNQNLRMDCDKSRSFEEDYREALINNNSSNGTGIRFLQPGNESSSRLRQCNSPVGSTAYDRITTRSPQSSGSSSNNVNHTSHRTSSPQSQNYGTRLCDHELTYDMLRKSPIMSFRRGESDYELPLQVRNRETINSGGNSELNFMSNETHIYEHPTTVLKTQRSVSRDEHSYRSTAALPRSSSILDEKKSRKSLSSCDNWPLACSSSGPRNLQNVTTLALNKPIVVTVRKQNSSPAAIKDLQHPHMSKVALKEFPSVINEPTAIIQPSQHTLRKSPQWTFLCSGGVKAPPHIKESKEPKLSRHCMDLPNPTAVIRPRVIPLAASSLVILGDCDYIRKPTFTCVKDQKISDLEKSQALLSNRENNFKMGSQSMLSKHQRTKTFNEVDYNSELIKPRQEDLRKRQRCNSMPGRIAVAVAGFPKSKYDDASVRCNGYVECLSQQMRAVSSPTISGLFTEQNDAPNNSTLETKPTNKADALREAGGASDVVTVVGGSRGVLHKFKRTLHNLNNRNQLQVIQLSKEANAVSSAVKPMVSITVPAPATDMDPPQTDNVIGDTSSAKYRFGPLIWRSSKDRRKTKFNRRDKCNSGDSGIQVEIEQDEQYMRALTGRHRNAITVPSNTSQTTETKACSIRRAHSAKASKMLEQPFLKTQLNIGNHEREAPESLPTRSLSQPNGLDIYGVHRIDIEDSDSESIESHGETNNYNPIYAEVLYNFTAAGPQELGLERGTIIEILRREVGPWWLGRIKKEDASLVDEILDPELGWFPKDFVRLIYCREVNVFVNSQRSMLRKEPESVAKEFQIPVPVRELETFNESSNATMTMDQSNITTIVIESPQSDVYKPTATINMMQNRCDVLQNGAVRELLETEVNYVKLLAAICEGYLPAMSKRIDIFSPNSIRLIFSNISAIYKFQQMFLEELRQGIEQNQIAKVFLKLHKGFLCYSTYCNAYPRALIELESYERLKDARIILENCRESENLPELPLSAHLLAPVQRICRYPLHLNELIKTVVNFKSSNNSDDNDAQSNTFNNKQIDERTQCNVPDTHDNINMALEKMRGITEAVNEGKRHSETIARHQASFQNFKGTPLHLHSTRFFLQVDATRQKQNLWNSSCTLFLFDNQLIYCKRDIIKRSHFIYKGRIFLDRCRIVNMRDGKMFGHTIKNSLRIYCESRDKWYDFSFRSANRKHRFLNTLALERQFGGKALYVSEMTGFEYNYEDRPGDFSDQSDYDCEQGPGATSASGDSSVPESPSKSPYRSCDTLPKKSQSRDGIASNGSGQMLTTTSTGSLGRRRLGNWFRKPKSSNCTPSQSPTHKPEFDADLTLTAARVAAIEMVKAAAAEQEKESSIA